MRSENNEKHNPGIEEEFQSSRLILKENLSFWNEYLRDFTGPAYNPFFQNTKTNNPNHFRVEKLKLRGISRLSIQKLLARTGATFEEIILSAFVILLHRYNCHDDICFGLSTAHKGVDYEKSHSNLQSFLPLRIKLNGLMTIENLIKNIGENRTEISKHQ
ncbi:MAG: hypothetical protein GY786_19585, partial [Proteobacteria bacterium]|nr:hypothetical protein [Pseudomonadota bacterium]